MKITIKMRNLDQSQALDQYIEERFGGLKKFVSILQEDSDEGKTLAEVDVEVEKETQHHRKGDIFIVKAKIVLPGKTLMVEAKEDDIFQSVTKARDEMKLEIEKYKFKKIDKDRREQRKSKKDLDI